MKKRMVVVILVLLAMALTTMTAAAAQMRLVTIRIYKHTPDVTESDTTLKSWVSSSMYNILEASDHDGRIELFYCRLGPYTTTWSGSGCSLSPSSPINYGIYFMKDQIAGSYALAKGGYVIYDINPHNTCPGWVFDPSVVPGVTHELGHVFGIGNNHNPNPDTDYPIRCVMDSYDVRYRNTEDFCGTCKDTITNWLLKQSEELNE